MSVLWKMVLPGLIRTILVMAGGYILKQGFVDGETWNMIAGVIMGLVGGTWSVQSKLAPANKVEVLDHIAAANPGVVTNAAVVVGVKPASIGVAPVYSNNSPKV